MPLPQGEFIAWCGERERYLLATDGQYVDAYDGSTKISAPSPTGSRWVQCGADGQYIVFPEEDAGRVRKFELETGKSAILATFDSRSRRIGIAFSPDMKTVASDQPLQLMAEAGHLRTISVPPAKSGQPVYKIVWSPDASKFFVAYSDTIDVLDAQGNVLKGALVAWDYESGDPAFPSCAKFAMEKTRDRDFRLQRGSCQPLSANEAQWREFLMAQTGFYKERMVDPHFEPPPDNRYLRKVVKSLYPDTHAYHHVGWTLHPRYFANLFKTKIAYEAYPEGQAEVDEMVARLRLDMKVIYDP